MTRRSIPLALAMVAAGAIAAGCGASTTSSSVDRVVPVAGVALKTATSLVLGGTEQLTAVVAPENATNRRVTWKSSATSIVTVDANGLVTAVGAGTGVVTATTVDGGKTASCVVTVIAPVVAVTGVSLDHPTLSLTAGDPGTSATLTATVAPAGASNQSITWSTSAPSVATVNASAGSTVTIVAHAPGTATITVTTADGAKTASCVVTVEAVKVTGVTVKASTSLLVGGTEQLAAAVAPSNATDARVTWKSSDTSVATVSATGLVTAVAKGTATITVTTVDGSKSADCAVTVATAAVPVTGVSLDRTTLALIAETATTPGTSATLTATVSPSNATNQGVTWSTSNASVATVSATTGSTVTVVAHAAGTATITVATANGLKKDCAVTVDPVKVEGVTVKEATTVLVGGSEQLAATVSPANATNPSVTWKSSDPAVATVSATGLVTGAKAGTATITVTTADGGKSATCTVTVNDPVVAVTGVTLDRSTLPLVAGQTGTLSATVLPSGATNQNVSWKSDAPSVADVSATTGSAVTVVANAAGKATITVTTADGGKLASCVVDVTAATVAVTGVSIDPPSLSTLTVGDTRTLTALVQPSTATDTAVTWATDSAAVEIVSTTANSVTVRAASAGTANVTVTTRDGGMTASLTVTVVAATVPVSWIDLDKATLLLGKVGSATSGTLTATVGPTDASNKKVLWTSSNPAAATVSETAAGVATVTAVGAGIATITATTEDNGLVAKCDVNVALLHQSITPGTATQLHAGKGGGYDTQYDPQAIESTTGGLALFAQGDGFKSDGGHFMFNNYGAGGAAAVPGTVNLKLRSYVGLPLASIQTSSPSVKVLLTAQPYPGTASMLGIGRHRNVTAGWGYVGVVAAKDASTPSPIVFDGMPPNVQLDVFNAGKDGTYTYLDLIRVEASSTAPIDNFAPDEVAGLTRITDATNTVTLGWKSPPDADFDHVECREGSTFVTVPANPSTPGSCVFSNLAAGLHTFTVKTVDTHGNASTGVTTTATLTATPPLLEVIIPADTASAYLNDDGSSTYSTNGAELPVHGLVYYAQKNRFKTGDGDGGIMTNYTGAAGSSTSPTPVTIGGTATMKMYVGIPAISSKPTVTVTVNAKGYTGKTGTLGLAQQTSVGNGTVVGPQLYPLTATKASYTFTNVPTGVQLDLFNAGMDNTYVYIESIRVE